MGKTSVGLPKHESKIIDKLIPFLRVAFKPKRGRDLLVFREFTVDNGVTDLSIFIVRTNLILRRMRARLLTSFASPSKASIIAPLIRFPILYRDTLMHHSGLVPDKFNHNLKSLLSAGAIKQIKKRNVFVVNPNLEIFIEQGIAIEAKMEDWTKALYQATRYASFANKTFVALESEFIHRAKKHIERFRANRVGLIGVDTKKGMCKIILSQTRKRSTSTVSTVIANEKVFAKYMDSHYGGNRAP